VTSSIDRDEPRVRYGTGAQSSNPDANAAWVEALIVATERITLRSRAACRARPSRLGRSHCGERAPAGGSDHHSDLKQVDPDQACDPFKDRRGKSSSCRPATRTATALRPHANVPRWVIERIAASSSDEREPPEPRRERHLGVNGQPKPSDSLWPLQSTGARSGRIGRATHR